VASVANSRARLVASRERFLATTLDGGEIRLGSARVPTPQIAARDLFVSAEMRAFAPSADVAVVIPVHNGRQYTARCLDDLRGLDGPEIAVVVVDDGSSDDTSAFLERHHPDVRVLPARGDLWWSGAVNAGCRFAIEFGARQLIVLNNDNLAMSENLIAELLRLTDTYRGVASAVIVEERPPGRREIYAAGGTLKWPARGIELREVGVEFREQDEDVHCDWLLGAALAFDADLFQRLGGFASRAFPQYRGDVDFTARAKQKGYACVVSYRAWVLTDKTTTWMNFRRKLTYREFLLGFLSLRSAYNLRETVGFAVRHCPKRWIVPYLLQFYLRYGYAFWKTRHRLERDSVPLPGEDTG
jgi:GT2 family glycosyltransferase